MDPFIVAILPNGQSIFRIYKDNFQRNFGM